MQVLVYGASGMVGQGLVRECLRDPGIARVTIVVRSPTGLVDSKLREVVQPDVADLGFLGPADVIDACFWCLGVSSSGLSEAAYRKVTHDLTVAVARPLAARFPRATFVFVSGSGTDPRSKTMWARVKGETEQAILGLPFAGAYAFRPGIIQPVHAERSKTPAYRLFYAIARPLAPLLRAVFPNLTTTTERFARAMIHVARHGATTRIIDTGGINALAAAVGAG